MKKTILTFVLLVCLTASGRGQESMRYKNNAVAEKELHIADPTIFVWQNTYYLTGTDDLNSNKGFPLYSSSDLFTWHKEEGVLKAGDDTWGWKGFWAPQWVETAQGWILFYTANEQIAVAEAQTLKGPFKQKQRKALDISEKNIDPFLLCDDDGRCYLYHVRFDHGNYLWVAEMDMERMEIKRETLKRCFTVTQPWEITPAYKSDPIMEGPTVMKMRGKYYMFYSANHFLSADYAVGYAVADTPMGPWRKTDTNPILHQSLSGEKGDGHGDVFKGVDGNLYYVYHVHNSNGKPTPRCTRIVRLDYHEKENGEMEFLINPKECIVPKAFE